MNSRRGKQAQNFLQLFFYFGDDRSELRLGGGGAVRVLSVFQRGPGAGDGKTLVVQQGLNPVDQLDVLQLIDPVAGPILLGSKGREFLFPEAQDVGLDLGDVGNFADGVIQAVV